MTEENKIYQEKYEFYRKNIEQLIEDFANNFVKDSNPFMFHEGAKEKMDTAKKGLIKILDKKRLTKEEEYFIYHEIGLNEILSKYHDYALDLVKGNLEFFYFLRNSEASRNLDTSVWFAKFLKVPPVRYIDAVLEKTPKNYRQHEFEGQLNELKISEEDTNSLLYKYDLNMPKEELPITKEYNEEVHKKKDLLSLLGRFGLR